MLDRYIYPHADNDYTIVAKMGLYCSQQYKRSIIQSSLSVGSLLGLVIMNVLSDLKGRRYALLADLSLAAASALGNPALTQPPTWARWPKARPCWWPPR